MKKLLGIGLVAAMVGANAAQAMVIQFNVTQGNPLDQEIGYTDIGSGTHTVGDLTITVGNRIVPNQSVWPAQPYTIGYEGYGLESQSGSFITLESATAITLASINISWYENNAQFVTYTPSTGPVFVGGQPWWWGEDGGVSATWSADHKKLALSSNAALFVNGGVVVNETPSVPEPGTIVLLGSLLGLGTLGGLRKRFFGAKKSVVA